MQNSNFNIFITHSHNSKSGHNGLMTSGSKPLLLLSLPVLIQKIQNICNTADSTFTLYMLTIPKADNKHQGYGILKLGSLILVMNSFFTSDISNELLYPLNYIRIRQLYPPINRGYTCQL